MARRKIGDAPKVDFTELPELTAQQQSFARLVIDGKTATDAYRQSYDCSNMLPNSIWREASLLRSHPKVSQWLSAARQAEMGSAKITLEQHVQRLDALKDIAVKTGNVGAAVQAEQIIGKVLGHQVERYEDVTRSDPSEVLKELAKESPEAARALAEQHGIALDTDKAASIH